MAEKCKKAREILDDASTRCLKNNLGAFNMEGEEHNDWKEHINSLLTMTKGELQKIQRYLYDIRTTDLSSETMSLLLSGSSDTIDMLIREIGRNITEQEDEEDVE